MKNLALAVALAAVGCAQETPATPPPVSTAPAAATPAPSPVASAPHEQPPPSLASKLSPFPHVDRAHLPSGLEVDTVEAHALPVVEIRVLVHAGSGFQSAEGVAEVTGEMLKEGGSRAHTGVDFLRRVESLGADLGVDVGADATTLSLSVVSSELDEAMRLLGEIVVTPRFDPAELGKVKARLADELRDAARGSGHYAAERVMTTALFPPSSPYAHEQMLASDIPKIDERAVREFHRKFFVASNAVVLVAGDTTPPVVRAAVDKHFGPWAAASNASPAPAPPPTVDFPPAIAPEVTRVVVADRPQSVQSDVFVSQLIPERHDPNWPGVRVAMQILGGGVSSRLFNDVREKRSLAYSASDDYSQLAHGAQPFFAHAGTQTPRTVDTVQGVLDDLASMKLEPANPAEVERARRYLSDVFAVRLETLGAVANTVATSRTLDLPDTYWDDYRAALRQVSPEAANDTSAKIFHPDRVLIVVAGDAAQIAEPLARFGEVTVVDPEHDFRVVRTVPKK